MTNPEDKDRWKKEANQLKKDLDNRKKIIKKREVTIKFPKKKPPILPQPPQTNIDDYLKTNVFGEVYTKIGLLQN